MISAEDEAILAQQDMDTLAEWYFLLNSWQWPQELPHPEPREYGLNDRRGNIMDWIEGHAPSLARYKHRLHEWACERFCKHATPPQGEPPCTP